MPLMAQEQREKQVVTPDTTRARPPAFKTMRGPENPDIPSVDQLRKMHALTGDKLTNSPDYKGLVAALDTAQQQIVERIATREIKGQSMLLQKDTHGQTLLDNLLEITSGNTLSCVQKKEVVSSLLRELENPFSIHHKGINSCVITAGIQGQLCVKQPAEYARIIAGLSTQGKVDLRDGSLLKLEEANLSRSSDSRSVVGKMFQDSMMAKVARGTYDAATDTIHTAAEYVDRYGESYQGIHDSEAHYGALITLGSRRRIDCLEDPVAKNEAMMHIARETGTGSLQEKLELMQANQLPEDLINVSMRWETQGTHTFHSVNVLHTDKGKGEVYLWNMLGPVSHPEGTPVHYEGPPPRTMVVVDQQRGIYKMAVNQFRDCLRWTMVEDEKVTTVQEDAMYTSEGGRPASHIVRSPEFDIHRDMNGPTTQVGVRSEIDNSVKYYEVVIVSKRSNFKASQEKTTEESRFEFGEPDEVEAKQNGPEENRPAWGGAPSEN